MYEIKRHHSKTMQALGLMLMAAVAISGCSSQSEVTETPVIREPNPVVVEEPEPMSLSFASMSNARALTRLTDEIVQNTTYRDIPTSNIHFIALKKNESDVITSVSNIEVDKEDKSDIKTDAVTTNKTRFYHFGYCDMPLGVNGCLVYAKAKDVEKASELEAKAFNGCLTESSYLSNYVNSTDQITFEPVSIYGDAPVGEGGIGEDGVHADAWKLANALTKIVTDVPQWSSSANLVLQNLLGNFTNHGFDLPGSATSVKTWIDALNQAAESSKALVDGPIRDILTSIMTAATSAAATVASLNYPQNIHLPDGAAVVRWAEVEEGGVKTNKFVPQLQTTTLDDINTITRFVYPPALYYFVNSKIKTSNSKVVFPKEDSGYEDDESWSAVLDRFTASGTVQQTSKAVAIVNPLQYAVAQLQVNLVAGDGTLSYNSNNPTDKIDISKLSLKGIIVGGQRKVNYKFEPTSDSDMDVKFIYDTQVNSGLTTTGTTSNTLVLQSWGDEEVVGEDVNVILEFEYSGTQEFKCLNGWVYPGTRFYLVGELKLKDANPSEGMSAADKNRVFTKDRITAVTMTVNSLEKAYNVLPSILSKNLEIGVQTTPKWVGTTTTPVILD